MAEGNAAKQERLRKRLDEVDALASPPLSLDRILALAGDAEAGVRELSDAIRIDPAITARVLRLANSAYFGFSRQVESVDEAVMVVGFRNVRNLAACAAVAPLFGDGAEGVDLLALWRHSCGVAEAARLVAARQKADDGCAYVGGLLHDLGQVALCEALGDEYGQLVAKSPRQGADLAAHERRLLGADHAWAGAELCERWRLSARVVAAIRGHHVWNGDPHGNAARVALAEKLAEREGFGDPLDVPGEAAPPDALLRVLKLRSGDVEALADQLRERREAVDLLYRESLGRTS